MKFEPNEFGWPDCKCGKVSQLHECINGIHEYYCNTWDCEYTQERKKDNKIRKAQENNCRCKINGEL